MRKLKYLLLLFSMIIISELSSFAEVNSNYILIDSKISNINTKLFNSFIQEKTGNKISVKFNNHSSVWLLRQKLFMEMEGAGIQIFDQDSSSVPSLTISIHECGVQYGLVKGERDSLVRIVKIKISSLLKDVSGNIVNLPEYTEEYSDIISRDDLPFVQSNQFDFANAPVPLAPKSFFREIAEPFIVISTAALVVVLFFTIRSG